MEDEELTFDEQVAAADAAAGGLPDGAPTQGNDVNPETIDLEAERSLFESIKAIPSALVDAATGEGQEVEHCRIYVRFAFQHPALGFTRQLQVLRFTAN